MVLLAAPPVRPRPGPVEVPGGSTEPDLFAVLRGPTGVRPRVDPGLAGGLRAWLEDAAFAVASARGEGVPALYLGPRRLVGGPEAAPLDSGPSAERVVARLVRALFRQLVTVATIGDPLTDALDALRADGNASDVVRYVESLSRTARAAMAEAVGGHAAHLRAVVPRCAPEWMPRTDDRVAIPLAGGRVILSGVFDLLVGTSRAGEPALSAIGLSVGGPPDRDRWALHYLALLETLRHGAPPSRLVLLQSATGSSAVEDVREEHLRAAAAHVAAWLDHRAEAGTETGVDAGTAVDHG